MRNTLTFIAIILAIYIPLSLLDYNLFPYSDGTEHGAAVRELSKNITNPEDPMLAHHSGDSPRFVPSILLMALLMKLLDVDVLVVLKFFLIIYFLLFLAAASLFSQEYFNAAGQAPWALLCLLFLWGSGWTGANAYMFSALLYTAYFPSVVSFSLSLMALYVQLRFLHSFKTSLLIVQILLGSLAFINHPLTGIFFFICSGLLYAEKRTAGKKLLYCYLLTVLTAISLMGLWPYYSLFANLLKIASGQMAQTADYQTTRDYLYTLPLLRTGPALAGIPCVLLLLLRKRCLLLVGGSFVFALIYSTGYFVKISLAERFIFFTIFTLQMTFSHVAKGSFSPPSYFSKITSKKILPGLLLLLLLSGITMQAFLVYTQFITPAFEFTSGSFFPRYVSPNRSQRELKKYLGDGDVVLSDLYSSWSIPVYTGAKIIALFHTSPHIDDNLERINAVKTFYDSATPNTLRKKILNCYGVTHIYLNFLIAGKDIEPTLKGMGFPVVARSPSFCLFSVSSGNL